jgi:hypothetical protein
MRFIIQSLILAALTTSICTMSSVGTENEARAASNGAPLYHCSCADMKCFMGDMSSDRTTWTVVKNVIANGCGGGKGFYGFRTLCPKGIDPAPHCEQNLFALGASSSQISFDDGCAACPDLIYWGCSLVPSPK